MHRGSSGSRYHKRGGRGGEGAEVTENSMLAGSLRRLGRSDRAKRDESEQSKGIIQEAVILFPAHPRGIPWDRRSGELCDPGDNERTK